jgi:hypothetical protein
MIEGYGGVRAKSEHELFAQNGGINEVNIEFAVGFFKN